MPSNFLQLAKKFGCLFVQLLKVFVRIKTRIQIIQPRTISLIERFFLEIEFLVGAFLKKRVDYCCILAHWFKRGSSFKLNCILVFYQRYMMEYHLH